MFFYEEKMKSIHNKKSTKSKSKPEVDFNKQESDEEPIVSGINKSSEKIHFESNDILDDYKK